MLMDIKHEEVEVTIGICGYRIFNPTRGPQVRRHRPSAACPEPPREPLEPLQQEPVQVHPMI